MTYQELNQYILHYQYGTIAVYAIITKGILGCDIDTIKRRLVANLEGQGNKLELEQIFRTIILCNLQRRTAGELGQVVLAEDPCALDGV